MIYPLTAAVWRGVVVEGAAGAQDVPDLARDAMHVNGEADPAIANERQPEFFFAHDQGLALRHRTRKQRYLLIIS